jgi:hypothetical protein
MRLEQPEHPATAFACVLRFQISQHALDQAGDPGAIAVPRERGLVREERFHFSERTLVQAQRHCSAAALKRARARLEVAQIVIERANEKIAKPAFRQLCARRGLLWIK